MDGLLCGIPTFSDNYVQGQTFEKNNPLIYRPKAISLLTLELSCISPASLSGNKTLMCRISVESGYGHVLMALDGVNPELFGTNTCYNP